MGQGLGILKAKGCCAYGCSVSTDLLMQVLVSLSNLQTSKPGQRSGLSGACSDVYGAVKRTLLLCGPFTAGNDLLKHFP